MLGLDLTLIFASTLLHPENVLKMLRNKSIVSIRFPGLPRKIFVSVNNRKFQSGIKEL